MSAGSLVEDCAEGDVLSQWQVPDDHARDVARRWSVARSRDGVQVFGGGLCLLVPPQMLVCPRVQCGLIAVADPEPQVAFWVTSSTM